MDREVQTLSQPQMPDRGADWRLKSKAASSYRKRLFLIHPNPPLDKWGVDVKSPWPLLIGYSLSQNLYKLLITQNQFQVHMVTQSGPFHLCNLSSLTSLACLFHAIQAFLLAQETPAHSYLRAFALAGPLPCSLTSFRCLSSVISSDRPSLTNFPPSFLSIPFPSFFFFKHLLFELYIYLFIIWLLSKTEVEKLVQGPNHTCYLFF